MKVLDICSMVGTAGTGGTSKTTDQVSVQIATVISVLTAGQKLNQTSCRTTRGIMWF